MAINEITQVRVKNKIDTIENWTASTEILLEGEIAIAISSDDSVRLKIGNGLAVFDGLPFIDDNLYLLLNDKADIVAGALDIEASGSGASLLAAKILAPNNKVVGNSTQILFGVEAAIGNAAEWNFYYAGDNSALNRVDFGISGIEDPVFSYNKAGNLGIGTTTPSAKLEVIGNVIADDPINDDHLTTKSYVDDKIGEIESILSGSFVLTLANWSSNIQSISIPFIKASGQTVWVSPATYADGEEWALSGVFCTTQTEGSLSFSCKVTPTKNIGIIVSALEE